jgi:hypothetical protein
LKATDVTSAKKAPEIIRAKQRAARKQAMDVTGESEKMPANEKANVRRPKLCRLRLMGMEVAALNGLVREENTMLAQIATVRVPAHMTLQSRNSSSSQGLST